MEWGSRGILCKSQGLWEIRSRLSFTYFYLFHWNLVNDVLSPPVSTEIELR